jgi:hypothetical protein
MELAKVLLEKSITTNYIHYPSLKINSFEKHKNCLYEHDLKPELATKS